MCPGARGRSDRTAWATTDVDDIVGAGHAGQFDGQAGLAAPPGEHGDREHQTDWPGESGMVGVMVDCTG